MLEYRLQSGKKTEQAKNGYGDLTTDITYVTLGGEKTEANARLIAAAPTMYDAMLNAIACAGHGTGARQELAAQIIEILSPAIAKAIRA